MRPVRPVSRYRDIARSIPAASPERLADKADYTRVGKRTSDARVAPARWQISLKSETRPAKSANPCPRKGPRMVRHVGWHRVCFQTSQSSAGQRSTRSVRMTNRDVVIPSETARPARIEESRRAICLKLTSTGFFDCARDDEL